MDKRYRFRWIKAIELIDLPPEWDKRSYHLKIFAGEDYKKTKTFKVKKKECGTTPTPKWTINFDLSHISESERFTVDVYCRRGKGSQCLGMCGTSIRDILIGETDIIVLSISSNSSCPNISLKIFREGATDYSSIAGSAGEDQDADMSTTTQSGFPGSQQTSDLSGSQLVATSAKSVEEYWATAGKVVEETAKPIEPSEWISELIDGVDTVKSVIDAFKDLHPAASIAWGIITSSINVLKQQTERDKTMLQLYEAMLTTYKEASDDRLLWKRKHLEPIYKSLFRTTNECGMLIKRYTNKNRIKRFFSMDMSQKAEEFIQGFAKLREQLDSGVAKDALVVMLGVGVRVDKFDIRMSLQELKPGRVLGPKSTCMGGTRMQTINSFFSWIAECDNGVLWRSGLAGTGKSSVVGTLHDLLCFHMSGRSRLAAFIRYDRSEYRDSSELITSIAYSLGMFDQRIGEAIANAVSVSRAALRMTASESRTQFRLLLQEPLETIRDLQDEGPLVVIIDALDESDASEELLKVLADGFGPTLPFMRLIVSSRPEERISCVFKNCQHVHHRPLDTSSDEVKHDIRHFIRQRFASIKNKRVWGMYNEQFVVTQLAERASGLFIWATTVCSFLCDFPSLQRLKAVLETTIPADAMEALTILYRTALDTIVSEVYGTKEDVRQCILAVLGALIVRKGDMTVPILELVLQEGDPSAQLITDKLGSVVTQERSGNLVLIHKSFDDFLRDHGRCGDRWFIDVKEREKELARQCMLSLAKFAENWTPPANAQAIEDQVQPTRSSGNSRNPRENVALYHVVPSHIRDYALNVLEWHIDALLELEMNAYHRFFEHYFLSSLKISYACSSNRSKDLDLIYKALLKVISRVNAEVTDQSVRTYVYHAFTFWERTYNFVKREGRIDDPEKLVYNTAMFLSPSTNFICRDWGRSGRVHSLFDKERLVALIPWSTSEPECMLQSRRTNLSIFPDPRYIQFERLHHRRFANLLLPTDPHFESSGPVLVNSLGYVRFDLDTGRIAEKTPPSILQHFYQVPLPASCSTKISYQAIDPSVQIVRFVFLKKHKNVGFQSPHSSRCEVVDGRSNGPHDLVDGDVLISILNTRTSHCENYLFFGWNGHVVVQYAHGVCFVNAGSGTIQKVEPGTQAGSKEWMRLDGWTDNDPTYPVDNVFTVTEDGSRLLGLAVNLRDGTTHQLLLQEWETSTGTLLSTYGRFQSLS
ncbi:uncharacterized protein EV420DRAFT_1649347 [Desarmillaria tabescens]|uniref:Nephrocystin 3-like N-terminal domain-containing protein n=1 Tax=Armillaria tabescens TaxID=1929756 RepID=A0AA39MR82_ARMTA|nr:uncharacterized protein EV420DRAFT_1649347 [Desarmillaria tabescens]KAK0443059.1 hypothetical protein EV420DRAFT_1649347 [Desarmillaria tabescens]